MHRMTLAACAAVVLCGCAPMTTLQQTCDQNQRFVAMVDCLNKGAAGNAQIQGNPLRRQYIAYANLLAEQVQQGSLSETKARYLLAEKNAELAGKFNEASQRSADAVQRSLDTYRRNQPVRTDCYTIGNNISCTSQ